MKFEYKLASLAAMGLSSFLAPKLAGGVWKLVTGKEPPSEEAGSRLSQILLFAAISAVAVASAQHIAEVMTAKHLTDKKGEGFSA